MDQPQLKNIKVLRPIALILLFSLCSLHAYSALAAAANDPILPNIATDKLALLSFKSLLSDPLGALASWRNESHNHCRWLGVTCGRRHPQRVTALDLDSLNLTGIISPNIANLTFLRRIHFPNNLLNGHIPQELGRLSRLQYLNLSMNSLEGEIPSNLGQCLNLQTLSLDYNKLSGEIPTDFSSLRKLDTLFLSNNNLTGYIPPLLGRTPSLTLVDLSGNRLTGGIPPFLANSSTLNVLYLFDNNLARVIPQLLGNSSSLYALDLSNNNLTGEIPPMLGSSPIAYLNLAYNSLTGGIPSLLGTSLSLQYLDLSMNSLTEEIPYSIGISLSLEHLDLQSNKLSGSIPQSFGNSSSLAFINLAKNNLMGGLPPFLAIPSSLSFLGLSMNQLSGGIPSSLGNISSLQYLYLASNNLMGSIPESLGNIPDLQELDLTFNNLSGQIPTFLYNCSSLTYFGVGSNRLSGTLPPNMGLTLPNLQNLVMQGNQFHGPIPVSLCNASGLQMLDLSNNSFSGLVPSNLGSLQNLSDLNIGWNQLQAHDWSVFSSLTNCSVLETLILAQNKFEGRLPSSVGNLSTQLAWLSIGDNQISGPIPAEIGNLVSLTVLFLDRNLFMGEIPETIGKLQNLHVMYLSGNKLSGPIPSTFGNLTQLNELYMQENELSGSIPASFGNCRNLELLNLSHNALIGSIPRELVGISLLAQYLDLSHNYLTGPMPMEVDNLVNLGRLDVSENRLSGGIPSTLGACQLLEHLYMQGNFFEGSIPQGLESLKGMVDLDLSQNNMSGPIPDFFRSLRSLQYLNLSFNDLEGEVPKGGIFDNATEISVLGNRRLGGGDPALQLPPCHVKGSKRTFLKVAIPVAGATIVLVLCLLAIRCRPRKAGEKSLCVSNIGDKYKKLSYADIHRATNGFSSGNLVGTGSFGSVYKGKIDLEEKDIIVKVFNLHQIGALKSFSAECEALRNMRHRNLVKIITSCSTIDSRGNDFKALVFEYMPNGSLEEWLHPKAPEHDQAKKLNLTQRLNIVIDVASGLNYLHHGNAVPVVHCDLKPSNILLDNDMTAHVGDFGLARFLSTSSSATSKNSTSWMGIKGSIGYVAPEYAMGSKISTQGDVYSYGILLLEILTGKKPIDDMFKDGLNLHKFVSTAFPEGIMEILDPQILQEECEEANNNSRNENTARMRTRRCITSLLGIGLSCSKESPKERMDMRDVANKLKVVKDKLSVVEIFEEGANLPHNE
ncbi:receptor kinase-like protein Xa21 [Phoenix dactylifera]|uniref:Receptor kinase-like protein Xa21 n=1 Tax=Phoenix dactylifera TaxID=42345 RepID=A0A8B8IZK4_PHODC|nr:receptor kinase-like protein Xa21 [Phoenix dactylifera]